MRGIAVVALTITFAVIIGIAALVGDSDRKRQQELRIQDRVTVTVTVPQ